MDIITDLLKLSQMLLLAAKLQDPSFEIQQALNKVSYEEFNTQLSGNENKKYAFWLNVYNSYIQLALKENQEEYKNRGKFFSKKFIGIAGKTLSFNQIEHGILRKSQVVVGQGYLSKIFVNKFEKEERVQKRDYRIHFALNCGAKSCPPVAFYKAESLDMQLESATKNYLKHEVSVDTIHNIVSVPKMMFWFKGDFGGKKGIYNILRKYELLDQNSKPKIKYSDYDWNLLLKNYQE
jgi:Protein of unknown function, DUF547